MGVKTEVVATHNLIIHHFSEVVSLQLILKTIQATLANSQYRAGMNMIWHCEDETIIDISSEDPLKISDAARAAFDLAGINYKLALVAAEDLAYGLLRVYEGWSSDRPIKIKTFRHLDEALAWVE